MNFGQDFPQIELAALIQKHGVILGMTGSGKTGTMSRAVEEILAAGGLTTVIDTASDYHGIASRFPILRVGKARRGSPSVDIEVSAAQASQIGELIGSRCLSVILDLSGFPAQEWSPFVLAYLSALWQLYDERDLPPMRIAIDEIQLFAPQGKATPAKDLLQDIAARGRKRHFTLLTATQKPQRVDKDLLDAADWRIFHRIKRGTTLSYILDLLPDLDGTKKAKEVVPGFEVGRAIMSLGDEAWIGQIACGDTFRPGALQMEAIPAAALDAALIQSLRSALVEAQAPLSLSDVVGAAGSDPVRIQKLEGELRASVEKNNRLAAQFASLQTERERQDQELDRRQRRILELEARLRDRDRDRAANKDKEQRKSASSAAPALANTPAAPTLSTAGGDGRFRSDLAIKRANTLQERRFNTLLSSLQDMSKDRRAVLGHLIMNEPHTLTIRQLAALSGYSQSTIHIPELAVTLGLISRHGRSSAASIARRTLAAQYADKNTDELIERLVSALEK